MTVDLTNKGIREIANNFDLFYIDIWGVLHNGIMLNEDAVDALGKAARRKDDSVEDVVSQAVRRVARSMFGLRPIAQVHIMRIGPEDLR